MIYYNKKTKVKLILIRVILFIIINIKTTIYATIRGDADQDIKVTAYDAYRALVLSADQNSGASVNADEVVMLDVEKNGNMSSNDAYLILKHSVGLITSF